MIVDNVDTEESVAVEGHDTDCTVDVEDIEIQVSHGRRCRNALA